MAATTMLGGNGMGIGIDLLGEKLESCVVGGTHDGSELWVWEGEHHRWHCHGEEADAGTQW